jgi:translocation and assembly module TamA
LDLIRTLNGIGSGDPNAKFLEMEGSATVRSHAFEYWSSDPRTGFTASATVDLSSDALISRGSAQRFSVTGESLWNFREYDPPLIVFGLRGGMQTTVSSERPGIGSQLPANFFWYLGGSNDLSGFSRQSVPQLGAMTAFWLNPEIRFTALLPIGLEPFAFWDIGAVGYSPLSFDSPVLYSPGLGLRFKSPVGVFRTTLARGYPVNTPGGWNFYFSFGQEF